METDEGFEDKRISTLDGGLVWNVLTIVVLLGTGVLIAVFLVIYANPNIPLNPYPPNASLAQVSTIDTTRLDTAGPTITLTSTVFPPTWTPTLTLQPTITATLRPTSILATQTPHNLTPATITFTPTDRPNMPFIILGTPVAVASTITHPGADCKWMGVGGQALDMQDAPIVGTTIELGGWLGSESVDMLSLTGTALQYGTAGYEFTLSNHPIASLKTLWVQLLDQAGLPLSNRVFFTTYEDCQKNLILITFKQVR
jgi:hypothetical protein